MFGEEISALEKRRSKIQAELVSLHRAFNAIEIREPTDEEKLREARIYELQDELERLKLRQDSIGGPGYNRYCPCCGIKIPYKYLKQLSEEIETKEKELNELLNMQGEDIYHNYDSSIAEAIAAKEDEIQEINNVIAEIKKASK